MIKVNDVEISEADISLEMQYHTAESRRSAQVKAAESLIIGELFKQRASDLKLKTVDAGSNDEDKMLQMLIEQEVDIPQATEIECERYFAANPDKFHSSAIVEARHILLAASPDDIKQRDETRVLAEQLLARLFEDPACFDELVGQYSACPSKEQGGNLGQISQGQTVPEFERVLMNSDVGLISFPVESRYGFHITLVERKIEGRAMPFDAVKEQIKQYLDERVRRKAISQYIETLIADAKIEGFDFKVAGEPLMQ